MEPLKKPTQEQKILSVLQANGNEWTNGQYFCRIMGLTQYHARIWGLIQKGYPIEASDFTDEFSFKSYRLAPQLKQDVLI